jgi:predicted XRE-type DNA-binding protein
MESELKPVRWIGRSLKDLRFFPGEVRLEDNGWQRPSVIIEKGRTEMRTKVQRTRNRVARATEGSGNVFADLGLPNPEQELLKAQLTLQIHTILKDIDMTQVEIAKILGVRQPQVSLLMRNRAGNFSVGRLMEFLTALRRDVEITIRPTRKEHGALSVVSS